MFDVTRKETFDHLQYWLDTIAQHARSDVEIILVGNKIDKPDRVVSRQVAEEWAKSKGIRYIETSAKNNEGIAEMFMKLCERV